MKIFGLLGFFVLCLVFPKSVLAAGASLEFKPAKLDLKMGEAQTLSIVLNPSSAKVIGVDLIIKFDPQVVQIDQAQDLRVFSRQMGLVIDNKLGILKMSISNDFNVFTSKPGEIAKIRVKALKTGSGTVQFDFTAGRTQDTNVVVAHGMDILTKVGSAKINITTISTPQALDVQAPEFTPGWQIITPDVWSWLPYLALGLALVALGVYNKNG